MNRRHVAGGLALIVLVGTGAALARGRRLANQRIADLGGCLLGAPLEPGELASDRMLRLELGRPKPEPSEKEKLPWPDSCQELAEEAASSRVLRDRERGPLVSVAEILRVTLIEGRGEPQRERSDPAKQRAAVDDVVGMLREQMSNLTTTQNVPWRPVTMLPRREGTKLCSEYGDWRDENVAVFEGKPGCAIDSAGADRLSIMRERTAADKGRPFPRDLPSGPEFNETAAICETSAGRIALRTGYDRTTKARHLSVMFLDAAGTVTEPIPVSVSTQYDDREKNPERSLDVSEPTLTCRSREARVAWSWATLIGGKPNEEIVVVTCVPGRCETKVTPAHVETTRHSNCGMCRPHEDQFQLVPPRVVDLFGTTALLWSDNKTLRLRMGAPDHLDDAVDRVLIYEPEYLRSNGPKLLTNGEVALIALEREHKTRIFRLDAAGPRELTGPAVDPAR